MNLQKAENIANELMSKEFIIDGKPISAKSIGYSFSWNRAHRSCGICYYNRNQIKLSTHYVSLNDESLVRNTILHEMAHAFSYHLYGRSGTGHGYLWKSVCVQIGAKPNRVNVSAKASDSHKYVLRHKHTNEVYGKYYRRPTKLINRIQETWIRGKKKETYGNLEIVSI
jgi:predicted SprT family Zn-dependent metalloprotease